MKTPRGTEVDLGPGHIVLDGGPAPAKGAQQPMLIVATVAHLSYKTEDKRRYLYLHYNFNDFGYRTKLSRLAFRATVRKTVRPMLSDRCLSCLYVGLSVLSCLSVMLVYCGQKIGWIKMKLGMQVCLGPGHVVLDGDPAPNFWPMSVVAKHLDGSRCHLVRRYSSVQATLC